ncbi:MAG: protein kinase [Acidobacteriota bacterium]
MKPLAQNSLIQNRYLIVQLIGKGGMGEVYLAVDQRLGSAVALKRTYFAGDEMLGNAFEREARTLARMRHPVLPKVSDHFGEGEEQYLVMEHISGDDLSKRLESAQKPFPISWVLFWADQLLDALSYLHSHEPPIIHRDIKPQNLKLTDENNIILLDFGLSKTSTGMTNISQSGSTGSVVGYTPHYAPMEQIRGIGTSAKSDLYSLSATLYQLLTNTVPPDALSRADSMLNGSPDPVQPLSDLNPEVSIAVSDVILKGMEVSQEKRFADAREMQKVLRRAFTEMQDAVSAKTVAFNGQSDSPAIAPGHESAPVSSFQSREQSGIHAPRTVVEQSGPPMPVDSPADVDFDATIAFDSADSPAVKQSDVKTEVFLAGSDAFQIPDAPEQFVPPTPFSSEPPIPEAFVQAEPAPVSPIRSENDGIPQDATMPVIAFEHEAQFPVPPPPPAKTVVERPAVAVKSKKSGSKAGLIIGGLAALFVLAIIAVGAGYIMYSNYYPGTAVVEPTPSPEPTLMPSPSPERTFEALTNSNANSESTAASNSNSSVNDLTVSATPVPAPSAQQSPDVATRPAPVPARTPAARPTTQSTPKTTPKPKTPSDRTVILQ